MEDNVVDLFGNVIKPTEDDIDPVKVLDAAKEKDLDVVIVLGTTKDGDLYLASSTGSMVEMHWLLSSSAHVVLQEAMD